MHSAAITTTARETIASAITRNIFKVHLLNPARQWTTGRLQTATAKTFGQDTRHELTPIRIVIHMDHNTDHKKFTFEKKAGQAEGVRRFRQSLWFDIPLRCSRGRPPF